MNLINTLSDDADQFIYYALPDGTIATLQFTYRASIQRWSVSVTYTGLSIQSVVLGVHPNILRQWRKLIPFGMAIISSDGYDPVAIDDFTIARITVYMLTEDDVAAVETEILEAA